MAPKIVIPLVKGPAGEASYTARYEAALRMCGVPASQVEEVSYSGGVASTVDEARALLSYSRLHQVRKVIVVTSDWHCRRTRWIMRRLLSPKGIDVMVTAAPDPESLDPWPTREKEYLKLFYYWLRYQFIRS
jgi:uncharacterized SAM-binding protein YcdF (DUF218 family)